MLDDACRVFWKDFLWYRVVGSNHGNQGSTGYLFSCQLSGLCPDYGATLVVFSCGAMVFSCQSLAACPGSAPGVLTVVPGMHGLFQNTCTTLAGSYNNDNFVCYVGKRLWYGTQLSSTLARLIITNQTSDTC